VDTFFTGKYFKWLFNNGEILKIIKLYLEVCQSYLWYKKITITLHNYMWLLHNYISLPDLISMLFCWYFCLAFQPFWKCLIFWENITCIEKTMFLFPFKLNGIWSRWQFPYRFWTKWNPIWFKIEMKTVTAIMFHLIWKEMEK